MESSLTETIWFSEKRRKILLLLLDGPKKPEEMKEAFGVAWRSLILPLKELREAELVCNPEGMYELSYIGKLIAETVKPVNGILNLFEKDTDYWVKRDLNAIPKYLLDRMGEIEDCIIAEPELNDMFEPPVEFTEGLLHSKYVHSVFSIYHPLYPPFYSELAEKETEVSIVLTQSVMQRMLEDKDKELQKMRDSQNTKLFLYEKDVCPPSMVVTDNFISASFFNVNGRYDHRDIMSYSRSSRNWGEEMFKHYQNMATEI
ncbi:winged helix-turn-helix domain-containing protein [Methanolobus vulcani]|uniref:Winged helix-turn-helix domain-containing protein n=1 Tax=Methanolobus vulcani TaxID=38026 RepID=A0A7Z8KSR0_9EURY|nr:winged helix-turn-helix domain-containing protein [Methanolobus vulcani]TQD28405.1 winged helix-turn-helix domain-containing protein [Methanolobus vulcani]